MSLDIGHQFTTAANFLDPSSCPTQTITPQGKKQIQISSVLDRVPKSSVFSRASCDSIWLENQALRNSGSDPPSGRNRTHGFIYSR